MATFFEYNSTATMKTMPIVLKQTAATSENKGIAATRELNLT